MTIIVKPPQYDYHGFSMSQYTIILIYCPSLVAVSAIDRFHSIFHHRNWRAKGSCDVDIDQSAGSMVM